MVVGVEGKARNAENRDSRILQDGFSAWFLKLQLEFLLFGWVGQTNHKEDPADNGERKPPKVLRGNSRILEPAVRCCDPWQKRCHIECKPNALIQNGEHGADYKKSKDEIPVVRSVGSAVKNSVLTHPQFQCFPNFHFRSLSSVES